jgi:hypothetical protein
MKEGIVDINIKNAEVGSNGSIAINIAVNPNGGGAVVVPCSTPATAAVSAAAPAKSARPVFNLPEGHRLFRCLADTHVDSCWESVGVDIVGCTEPKLFTHAVTGLSSKYSDAYNNSNDLMSPACFNAGMTSTSPASTKAKTERLAKNGIVAPVTPGMPTASSTTNMTPAQLVAAAVAAAEASE